MPIPLHWDPPREHWSPGMEVTGCQAGRAWGRRCRRGRCSLMSMSLSVLQRVDLLGTWRLGRFGDMGQTAGLVDKGAARMGWASQPRSGPRLVRGPGWQQGPGSWLRLSSPGIG